MIYKAVFKLIRQLFCCNGFSKTKQDKKTEAIKVLFK